MNSNSAKPLRLLSLSIATILLASCGGGSDDNGKEIPKDNKVIVDEGQGIDTVTEVDGDKVVSEVIIEPDDVKVDDNVNPNEEVNTDDVITDEPITASNEDVVFAQLDSRRANCGFGNLKVSRKLTDAAENHANYLLYMQAHSTEQFQGHYETKKDNYSGISNPYYSGEKVENRIKQIGQIGTNALPVNYDFRTVGENLSYRTFNQSYADKYDDSQMAIQGIQDLFAAPYHLVSLMSPDFTQVGISYGRDDSKVPMTFSDGSTEKAQGSVLEIVLASPASQTLTKPSKVLSYPCDGITGTAYELRHEAPNPFKGTNRDLSKNPIGQPIYILGNGNSIKVTNTKMTDAANTAIPLQALNSVNDPNKRLKANEVILMPLNALQPKQLYRVSYDVSVDGGSAQTKSFIFETKAK